MASTKVSGAGAPAAAAALLAAALAAGISGCSTRSSPPSGPVIIYLVDTLRFDRMSAYGATRPTSPAAERLAREGTRYDTAYATCTWTRPSVASLLTSRWPSETGAVERGGVLGQGLHDIPELFARAGWRTAAFSGSDNISEPELGFRRGFETFVAVRSPKTQFPSGDRVVDPAMEWIRRQTTSRFFLYVHVVDPHLYYDHFLPGYEDLFASTVPRGAGGVEALLAKYDAMVRQADDQFARLRTALEERGYWKSALVFYLADHGEQFFEHGGMYHGDTLYDETLRVPLIVAGPGSPAPGTIVKTPVSLLDILPSIARRAGLPADPGWRGVDILGQAPPSDREFYFSEELDGARLYGIRRANRKMIVSLHPPFRIEFDLVSDSGEQHPVDPEAALAERLERLRATDLSYYGGLSIHKTGTGAVHISGLLEDLDPRNPFLSWTDRVRFRSRLSTPETLTLDESVGADEPFDLRVANFTLREMPTARIRVASGGESYELDGNAGGAAGAPVLVARRPMSSLTPHETTEVLRRMHALGYLGGD